MITKMKKILLLTPDSMSGVDADLRVLGGLGLLHIAPFQTPKDDSIGLVNKRIAQMCDALKALREVGASEGKDAGPCSRPYDKVDRGEIFLMEDILEADRERREILDELEEHCLAQLWYQQWGHVTHRQLDEIRERGLSLKLYRVGARDYKALKKRKDIYLVGSWGEQLQLALISEDPEARLNFDEVSLPRFAYADLDTVVEELRFRYAATEAKIRSLYKYKDLLEHALEERQRRLEVRKVQFGARVIDETVRCWKGYMPEDRVAAFIDTAKEKQWGYVVEDPTEEDFEEVPTLVRTSRWARRIKPVMDFMGLVPGYKEIDVSKIFMLFFTFFAGILVGDAGYGLIFLLITFAVHAKMKFKKRIEIALFYTLSASIMIWGVLTGTYFGSEAIAELPLLDKLRVQQIASFGGDNLMVQKVMFFVGAIHLSIGHLQLAFRNRRSVKGLSQLGWVAIAWGLYLIVNQMVLGIPAPKLMIWLFAGGATLVAFFANPGKNFFKGMLSSLGSLPLSIISGFSDIISYIRLYAVGLSTVLMATSFNTMAIGDGLSTVASVIGASLVLILGHGLNMILAAMAVIVHGVRLNMLEYAGHADVEFSGSEYSPFTLKQNNTENKR